MPRSLRACCVLLLLVLVWACKDGRTVPPEAQRVAPALPGLKTARFWGDAVPPGMGHWLEQSREELELRYSGVFRQEHNYLALSGGGDNGAFGAGLLVGWTEAGTRPEFTIVTGTSTGALIAPFAFLGPRYDPVLREIYRTHSTKDLVRPRSYLAVVSQDGLYDTKRFRALIGDYVTPQVVNEIAREHLRGRTLYIGTTNIDAERPVTWNIGAIAASDSPRRVELIGDILLASAAIPGVFPPVSFEVEVDGKRYQELHVDGGVTAQIFLYPLGMDWTQVQDRLEIQGPPNVYAVFNGFLQARYEPAKSTGVDLAMRSVSSLIRRQGLGDLYRIYLGALRDGLKFNLAHIPMNFTRKADELFDPDYMTALFDLGFEMGRGGYEWAPAPPGFVPDTPEAPEAPQTPPAQEPPPAEETAETEAPQDGYPPPRSDAEPETPGPV